MSAENHGRQHTIFITFEARPSRTSVLTTCSSTLTLAPFRRSAAWHAWAGGQRPSPTRTPLLSTLRLGGDHDSRGGGITSQFGRPCPRARCGNARWWARNDGLP